MVFVTVKRDNDILYISQFLDTGFTVKRTTLKLGEYLFSPVLLICKRALRFMAQRPPISTYLEKNGRNMVAAPLSTD